MKAVIDEEKKNVDALRELMKSDDEDDEDFEEEEEEEDDDIVIDNVEDLKGVKRDGEPMKNNPKRAK